MYLAFRDEAGQEVKTIELFDPHSLLTLEDNANYKFVEVEGDSSTRITSFLAGENYAHVEVASTIDTRYKTFTKSGLTFIEQDRIEDAIENVIRQNRLDSLNIDQSTLDALRPNVNLNVYNIKEQKEGGSGVTYVVGYVSGFLIYMFLFIYGAQVMQGVLEEKTNKIVEILVATVRPFQLMMGKVIGIGSVGLLQFLLWAVLMGGLSSLAFYFFGIDMSQASPMANAGQDIGTGQEIANALSGIPFFTIIFTFIFYFLGGYFLYGALFAAVGSAVDSPAEAQQFMLPITIPLIASIIGLSGVMMNPDGSLAFWLSIIPFTSPVAMMGRIGFGMPPLWELALSMGLLVVGFIGSIWVAARIYRVGILMHGSKVNYKVLARWFMMKQ